MGAAGDGLKQASLLQAGEILVRTMEILRGDAEVRGR